MNLRIRTATLGDAEALRELIAKSARELGREDYTAKQIEAALNGAWGVDTELIRDGTYFVVEGDGRLAACGGWSRRKHCLEATRMRGENRDYWIRRPMQREFARFLFIRILPGKELGGCSWLAVRRRQKATVLRAPNWWRPCRA